MKKWEYTVIANPANNEKGKQAHLNRLGAEGWELVCIEGSDWYIFKRPIPPVEYRILDEDSVVQAWDGE